MSNQEIIMCARFQAKKDKLEVLKGRLLEMVELTSKEEGNLF